MSNRKSPFNSAAALEAILGRPPVSVSEENPSTDVYMEKEAPKYIETDNTKDQPQERRGPGRPKGSSIRQKEKKNSNIDNDLLEKLGILNKPKQGKTSASIYFDSDVLSMIDNLSTASGKSRSEVTNILLKQILNQ